MIKKRVFIHLHLKTTSQDLIIVKLKSHRHHLYAAIHLERVIKLKIFRKRLVLMEIV